MSPVPREERLLNLLSALLCAREPLPFSSVRGEVSGYDDPASEEALEKRFDRDKAALRQLGVPLEFVAEDEFGRSGYRVAKERFFLDEIRFSVEEGIVLAALQRAATGDAGDTYSRRLRSALAKISVDSPLTEAFRESVAEQQLIDPRRPTRGGEEGDRLATLAGALAAKNSVRFSYYTLGSGEVHAREVEPYGVGYFRGSWYLVGRDVEKGEERVFRTSRIRGPVEVRTRTYTIPADFVLSDRVGIPPWEMGSGPTVPARIRFSPEIAWMIEENLRDRQKMDLTEDGGGVLELPVSDRGALVRWTAQFGPMAEILEPPELRDLMVDHLTGLIGRYEG